MIRVLLRKLHFFWCSLKMFDQQMIIDIGKPLANGSVAWGTSRINLGFIWLHKCFHKNFALMRRSAQKKVLTIHLVTSETKMFLSKRVSEFKHRLYAKANLHMSLYSWTRFCIGLVCGFESRYWYPMINSICRQLRYKKGLEYLKIYGFENTPNTFFAQKVLFGQKCICGGRGEGRRGYGGPERFLVHLTFSIKWREFVWIEEPYVYDIICLCLVLAASSTINYIVGLPLSY